MQLVLVSLERTSLVRVILAYQEENAIVPRLTDVLTTLPGSRWLGK